MRDSLEQLLNEMLELAKKELDMGNGKDGGNSPSILEIGDALQVTRLLGHEAKKDKTYYSSWSSPEAFARHIEDMDGESWYGNGSVWHDANEHFSGVKNIREALDLCRNGWKEGGETIERTRGYIHALNPTLPKPIKYAIAGSTPNVPRAVAGNILSMRAPEEGKSGRRPVITIVYNMCEAGFVDKDWITNKAAVTAALVDVIESQGFACEVIAVAYTGPLRMDALTSICVKPSEHPVDTNRLAFSLGHAAMFRVLFFADWEGSSYCESLGWGLGRAQSTEPTKEENEKHIYTIQSSRSLANFKDLETASTVGVQELIKELQQQGCPAFPKGHEDDLDQEPPEEDEEYQQQYYDDDF